MTDGCGRSIHYLRLSVTDRCNLRCRYCMPAPGVPPVSHGEVLTYEELLRLAGIFAGLGVNRIRITGGEPLVRRGLTDFIRRLSGTPGIRFLGLTTNGILLPGLAGALCQAGIHGVNISLDTTSPARYARITRCGSFEDAWRGLQAALAQPFASVRINCVLSPLSEETDWMGVAALAKTLPVDVRLIEWMPLSGEAGPAPRAPEVLQRLEEQFGPLAALPPESAGGPASYWQAPGFAGRIGLIPAMSHSFCAACNRVRLGATGDLRLCLFYDMGIGLKALLRGGVSDADIADAICGAVRQKPTGHQGVPKPAPEGDAPAQLDRPCGMSQMGG